MSQGCMDLESGLGKKNIYFTKVSMSEDWDPEMHALENQFMFRFYFFGCLSAGLSKNSDFHDTW